MTGPATGKLDLPGGLSGDRASALARLVAATTGRDMTAAAWLAPALLLARSDVRTGLALPDPGPAAILVQEYQAIEAVGRLPTDTDLTASVDRRETGAATELRFAFASAETGDAVSMVTALRSLPLAEIAGRAPTRLRPGAAEAADALHGPVAVPQQAVEDYLELSGDDNPIHRDARLAAGLGLPAPVVPGLFLVALAQPFVQPQATGLRSLKVRFLAPLASGRAFHMAVAFRGEGANPALRQRVQFYGSGLAVLAVADLVFDAL